MMNDIPLPTKVLKRLGLPFNQQSTIVLSVHAKVSCIGTLKIYLTRHSSFDNVSSTQL